jgi:ABC-2 type transport system permease protein
MRDIALILTTSIRNNLRLKSIAFVFIGVVLICVIGLNLSFCLLLIAPAVQAAVPDHSMLELYLNMILYTTCLIGVGINMNVFAFQSMTREKSRGNLESLLATPLEVKDIWIAKSLAVFLPGLALGEVLTLISLLAVNYIYFVPRTGFLMTPWIAVSSFVCVPLIYLGLSLLVHLVGLAGKPATGNAIVQVFLPLFASLMINLMLRSVLDASDWPFTVANLGIFAVMGIILISIRPLLTKEKIVLSR